MEILTAAYFGYLAALAVARRKVRPAVLSMAALVCIFTVGMPHVMPFVYLLSGYWLPALLVREPNTGFEQRLLDVDRTLFGSHGLERFEQRAPRALIEYLELAYLLCYAVVPAGFVCLLLAGYPAACTRHILVGRAARCVRMLRSIAVAADARAASYRTART